jgi:hypothetical protein
VEDQTGLSNLQRLGIVVGAIVVLVVAYVLISGGSDDGTKDATTTVKCSKAS